MIRSRAASRSGTWRHPYRRLLSDKSASQVSTSTALKESSRVSPQRGITYLPIIDCRLFAQCALSGLPLSACLFKYVPSGA
jgi:hypothetical protein